jgi:hypothetical protein
MRTWGRIPVRGTPLVNCGAPASQTLISSVAGCGHESYTKNAGQKGARFKDKSREGQDSSERLKIMKPTQVGS